jgi:uncharacterized membrane protein
VEGGDWGEGDWGEGDWGRGRFYYIRHIFILNEMRVQGKKYILVGTLLGLNILLITYLLVPVLAANYKLQPG